MVGRRLNSLDEFDFKEKRLNNLEMRHQLIPEKLVRLETRHLARFKHFVIINEAPNSFQKYFLFIRDEAPCSL